jgi:glycosyltransferase involved in cell wall biosynthesis
MCSITEGFGLAAYEAMLAEKLCIFSDIPPFKELVEDGVNCFIFENKNVESLTKVLDDVIRNFDKYEYIRKYGREFVKTKLSEEEMVSKYNSLYNIF